MPSWRCPYCSTPQPEASRCWVCHRSSTSCGTCRHFRQSVAARTGFCGLDRTHEPLRGDEVRSCWEDGALPLQPEPSIPGLLDLLTERALPVLPAVPVSGDATAGIAGVIGGVAEDADSPIPLAVARLRPADGRVVKRDWVEIEA